MKPLEPRPGQSLGVIAPASLPLEADRLERGIRTLETAGYPIRRFRESIRPVGYLAGTDEDRLKELNDALRSSEPGILLCARGGYGTLRLLPDVDYEAARAHPKLLIGYSDITALQLALYHRSRVQGLSGSMVAVDWVDPHPEAEQIFWRMLRGRPPMTVEGPDGARLRALRPGAAEGVLLGGNLSMLTRLVGTPFLPSMDGAILFLEDVGEAPYRIDGLLAHLRLAGILDRIGGLVFGMFTGHTPEDDRPTLTYDEVIAHYVSELPIPVAAGLAYGHVRAKHAMPIGVQGRLEVHAEGATLTVLESLTL